MDVYKEIRLERGRQVEIGYTRDHDAAEGGVGHLAHWLLEYAQEAHDKALALHFRQVLEADVRRKLIQVAALAVAAVEFLDQEATSDH